MKYTLITLKLLNFYFALAISIEYDVLVKEEDAEIQERVIHTNARAHQLIQDQPVIQTERVCVCVCKRERERRGSGSFTPAETGPASNAAR